MATLLPAPATRQPFAPIDGARLQNLTSLKNRQNALPIALNSPSKRKAVVYEEDGENIDPIIFASPKRSKGQDGNEVLKASVSSHFILTKAVPTFKDFAACSPPKSNTFSSRPMLQPRSPAPKLNTTTNTTASALSAPAGRSPTRKRIGILNRRRTASTFTRVDPPKFNVGPVTSAPFSIAAALSGTIPSYGARQATKSSTTPQRSLVDPPSHKSTWFFEIHEDTAEETMTNLMEHSTCTLDISSDEEIEVRRRDERGKENVPPLDDISQTSGRTAISASRPDQDNFDTKSRGRSAGMRRRKEIEEGAIDIDRSPLSDLATEDFWGEGCTSSSVILIAVEPEPELETDIQVPLAEEVISPLPLTEDVLAAEVTPDTPEALPTFSFAIDTKGKGRAQEIDLDELMTKMDAEAPMQAKLFQPLEKAEEGWGLWESGSAKGDGDEQDDIVLGGDQSQS